MDGNVKYYVARIVYRGGTMRVKLSVIIDAIDMMDQYSEGFLDKETGEVEVINEMPINVKLPSGAKKMESNTRRNESNAYGKIISGIR